MSDLRPLLRLEDKVKAEGRRLQNLGGPSMRWVVPAVLIAAVSLHGVILLLPAARLLAASDAASAVPNFPLVWRPSPASVQPPEPPARRNTVAVKAVPEPAPQRPPAIGAARAFSTEPLPEPAPELALATFSAYVESIMPNPDTPPPSPDVGPPSLAQTTAMPGAAPTPIEGEPPVYPIAARSFRAEGRVTLRLAVLADGSVAGAVVLACSRPGLGFEAAALKAVKRWRYEPAPRQSGSRHVSVTIDFQQKERRP